MEIRIHNAHMHVFTTRDVPVHFLPLGLVRILARRTLSRRLARLLNRLNPRSHDDFFQRYSRFMSIGNEPSQERVLRNAMGFYPRGTVFSLLSMDMAYMGRGRVPRPFRSQLEELAGLKVKYGDLVEPFVCVDPRRNADESIADLVAAYVTDHHFRGVKLYPAMGYFPWDSRLDDVYRFAEQRSLPVVSHVSRGGVHCPKRMATELLSGRISDRVPFDQRRMKRRPWTYFSHPVHYQDVLERFPRLKLCMGHFGGDADWNDYLDDTWFIEKGQEAVSGECWFSIVLTMLQRYPNLYADISYTLHDKRYLPLLKVILQNPKVRDKVLFGSDFYMMQCDASERAFSLDVRAFLGESDFRKIAETNPRTFLYGGAY